MDVLTLLERLIRIPSENGGEEAVARALQSVLEAGGVRTRLHQVGPGRANLYAWTGPHPRAVLVGHLDVVPAGPGWERPPFDPVREGDRLYGRGAADMKGGVAAMAAALLSVAAERPGPPAAAVFVADEEAQNLGMRAYLADPEAPRAPLAILGEPTELKVCLGHKGASLWRLRTAGTAGHAAVVTQPDSAIWKMGRLLGRLEHLAERLRGQADPRLGPRSLNCGTLSGGTAHNVVPAACTATLDRRVMPGDTYAAVEAELRSALDLAGAPYHLENFLWLEPSWTEQESPVARLAGAAVEAVGGAPAAYGPFPATCEAGFLSGAGMATVILGPGSLAQAHVADEYVSVGQVRQAEAIYRRILTGAVTL